MPRYARKKSSTGIYHVILRGINREKIFGDTNDYKKFIRILKENKAISEFVLYGYCLMNNHVHLLMRKGNEDLGQAIKRIGIRYAKWFNFRYTRSGHLFQDRYKSEPVEDDTYFFVALRYIHRNPIKAGLCKSFDEYIWSSYGDYTRGGGVTDTDFAIRFMGKQEFISFMYDDIADNCLEYNETNKKLTDDELVAKIENMFRIDALTIRNEPQEKTKQILNDIFNIGGVSIRQISRITWISEYMILKLIS